MGDGKVRGARVCVMLLGGAVALLGAACNRNDPGVPEVEVHGDGVEFGPWHWKDAEHTQLVADMTRTGGRIDYVRYRFYKDGQVLDQGMLPGNVFSEPGRKVQRYWPMATTFHASGDTEQVSVRDADLLRIDIEEVGPIPADNLDVSESDRPIPGQ